MREVRAVFRLVGECRERGYDSQDWAPCLLAGLQGLIGAPAALIGDLVASPPSRRLRSSFHADALGMSIGEHRLFLEMLQRRNFLRDPPSRRLFQLALTGTVWSHSLLQDDRDWRRSVVYDEFLDPLRLDDALISAWAVRGSEQPTWIGLCRARGEPRFGDRSRSLLRLFHRELGPQVGVTLAPVQSPGPAMLPPACTRC